MLDTFLAEALRREASVTIISGCLSALAVAAFGSKLSGRIVPPLLELSGRYREHGALSLQFGWSSHKGFPELAKVHTDARRVANDASLTTVEDLPSGVRSVLE